MYKCVPKDRTGPKDSSVHEDGVRVEATSSRPQASSSSLRVRNAIQRRQPLRMETTAKFNLRDLFFEALMIEWRIVKSLGQAIAGAAVFVVVQFMNIVTYPAALIIDSLGLLLGFEVSTVVGVRRADD